MDCADALFKLLSPKTTHSILGGELNDRKDEFARKLLGEVAVIAKDLNFKHPCFCYVLYVNNLSQGAVATIHEGLKAHKAYLGYQEVVSPKDNSWGFFVCAEHCLI